MTNNPFDLQKDPRQGNFIDTGDPSTWDQPDSIAEMMLRQGKAQKDERGRVFVTDPTTGKRSYVQTHGEAQQAKDQSGFFRSSEWNPDSGENENHINWGNLIGLGVAGTIGGAAAAGAIGAGGAAAGGSGLSTSGSALAPTAAGWSGGGLAGGAGAAGATGAGAAGAGAAGAGAAAAGGAGAGLSAAVPTTISGLTTPGVGAAATSAGVSAVPAASSGLSAAGVAGKVLKGFDDAEPILAGMANRGSEANAARDMRIPAMSAAQLARDKFGLDAPGTRMKQSLNAALLKNWRPSQYQWGGPGSVARGGPLPKFTGGYGDSLMASKDELMPLLQDIIAQNQARQHSNQDYNDPYLSQFGETSGMDKTVGTLATIAALAKIAKGYF